MTRLLPALTAAVLLQACSGMRTYPDVEAREPITAQSQASRPVTLGKVRFDIEPGTVVLKGLTGVQCGNDDNVAWNGTHPDILTQDLGHSFYREFQAAHYAVVDTGEDLFDSGRAARAELLVGAIVVSMSTDICHPWAGVGVFGDVKGTSYIRIKWQIYDALAQKIVYLGTSEGRFDITQNEQNGWRAYLDHAMDLAVRNLLADQRLSQALLSEPQLTDQPAPQSDAAAATSSYAASIPITAAQPASGIEAPRAATVVVTTAAALGSGVIISPDGYILTNYHVVQDAARVRVRLADNREQIAYVLRRDSRRDVALLKLDGSGYPAAALRLSPDVQVGDEVFAIGSPWEEQNALTVTRGIISAFRSVRGYPIIQSDVSIQHGNSGGPLVDRDGKVIALCVAGLMSAANTSEGLNFFIPIDDAINRLHIQFQ